MTDLPDHAGTAAEAAINDCWNRIGVRGDHSCPELARHVHCRNCPVHSAAAASLLDGALPDAWLDERAGHFAQEKQVAASDTRSVLIFRIGAEWLALPTAAVVEVADLRPVHTLPHRTGNVVLGLVNVRGELLVCVSLADLLGQERTAEPQLEKGRAVYGRMLVLQGDGGRLAVPVDEVHGTHRVDPRELQAVPATVERASATYTGAMLPWRERAVGCLDDKLMLHTLNRSLA